MTGKQPWFAPKLFGYGSGLPIAWQGWAVYGTMATLCVGIGLVFGFESDIAKFGILTVCLLPTPLIASRTAGGWKWRWGWTDDLKD